MTIKHLVICGGGPLGLRYLGALDKLERENFFNTDNIESIYGTSVGSILGAFICLKYDRETLLKYVIERPWHEVFKIDAKQLFSSYYKKGLFDKKIMESMFKPLLKAKDLSLNITLKEFYEFSKIDLHIFTFELNKFETIELSHKSHPDLELLDAITMSSALPGVFIPLIVDDLCYIDGGFMYNFPINHCVKDHPNKEEILGIKCSFDNNNDNLKNIKVTHETSLLEYIIGLTLNSMNYIRDSVKLEHIDNIVRCNIITENPLTLSYLKKSINDQELRIKLMKEGEEDAIQFLSILKNKQDELNLKNSI